MKQIYRGIFFSLLPLIFVEYGYSQAYNFTIYSVNEGLPHAQVTDLIETSDGYLWVGTSGGGVARFDGRIFEAYTSEDGLRDDFVNVLYEDSQKRLWVATYYGGISYLDKDRFVNPFEGHLIDESYVTFIEESPDGDLWIGTYENGIFIQKEDSLHQISDKDGLLNNTVWHVLWATDGKTYISTHSGLTVFDGNHYKSYSNEDGLSGTKVFKGLEYNRDEIWFATDRGITLLNDGVFTTITEIHERPLRYIFDIYQSSDQEIWIGTENDGLFRFVDGEFIHINKTDGLSSNYIYRFMEDSDSKIWIATDENGINRFEGEDFRVFNTRHGLPSNEILSLFKDRDGVVWIGTDSGLTSFNGDQFETFVIPVQDSQSFYVWDIDQWHTGDPLVVDYFGRILQFDGNEFIPFEKVAGVEDLYVYDILVDSNDHLWIGSEEGLYRVTETEITHFSTDEGLPGVVIFHIFESKDGTLLLGTNNGLSRFDGESFINVLPYEGLSHYNVNYIAEGLDGKIWLGTSGGITLVEHFPESIDDSPVLKNFGQEHGMLLIETLFLWVDEENQVLWQGTNGGLHSLNLNHFSETGEMRIEHHRLSRYGIGVETTHKALFESDGKLWFGSMQGVVILDPGQIVKKQKPPKLFLKNILINGSPPDWTVLGVEPDYELGRLNFPEISFPHNLNNFTFQFNAIEFTNPESIEFRFRLNGLDTDWSYPTKNQSITYASLGPGNYSFEVQSRSGTGLWSESVNYHFAVSSPFWLTNWFLFIILLVAVLLTAFVVWIYNKKLERERLKELVEERTNHLKSAINDKEILVKEIHHRVKNNLAMIIGLLELQVGNTNDQKTINALRDSILRIYSMSLVHEKLYSNDHLISVNVRHYISDLIEVISHSMNLDAKNIKIETELDDFQLSLDHGITCGLLMNEIVTNSVKHAFKEQNGGKIEVRFLSNGLLKIIEIKDNGSGIPEKFRNNNGMSQLNHSSLGLTLIQTLAQQMNGSIEIDASDQGTCIKITFEHNPNS